MSGVIPRDYGKTDSDYDSNGIEATGVFSGILQEDMIDTVRRTHKPFIDVLITNHFDKTSDYPLTYVPLGFNTLPLRKGQEVLVRFNQDNPRYPVLFKIPQAYTQDGVFLKNLTMPDSTSHIDIPASDDSKDIFYFNENFQVVATEDYLVFRQKDYMTIYEKDRFTVEYPNVQVHAEKTLKIEVNQTEEYFHDTVERNYDKKVTDNYTQDLEISNSQSVKLSANSGIEADGKTGKVVIKNSIGGSLGDILDSLLNTLATTVPTTMGSPTAQNFNPVITTAIDLAKSKIDALLKG